MTGASICLDEPPPPPSPLKCNLLTLPARTVIHRIHDGRFSPNECHPGTIGNSRFAPIAASDGAPIPTLYAATTFECAAFETVFHNIDPCAAFKSVPWTAVERLSYSILEFNRDVRLAKMFSADLLKWNCSRAQLIDTPASCYPRTRPWAAAIYDSDASIGGMIWTAHKYDEEKAMMLFGGRIRSADLTLKSSVAIVNDRGTLEALHDLAQMSGIFIAR